MVKYMSTRMDKYYRKDREEIESRTQKNSKMYASVTDDEYEKVNLTNNVSIIDTESLDNLDVEKIKEILNEKYKEKKEKPKPSDFRESLESDIDPIDMEDTKEYDLKKVLESAHKNKKPDYDRERFAKIREQEYDILKSLNIDKKKEEIVSEENLTVDEANLMNLIKTVNYNAEKFKENSGVENSKTDEGELLSDLIGNDGTEVLEPVTFEDDVEPDKKPTIVEELERTKQLSKIELEDAIDELHKSQDEKIEENIDEEEVEDDTPTTSTLTPTEELSNSFYTGKLQIDDKDMDFKDLEGALNGGSIVIKILIVIVILIIIGVAVFLLNKYLNLGLF